MAAGSSLLACVALFVCAFLDLLEWDVAAEGVGIIGCMALLFGVLRLSAKRLLVLAVLALAAHGAVLHLSYLHDDYGDFDLDTAVAEFAVLMIVLPWFAVMGGYVNRMRLRLADTNRELSL